MSFSALGLLAIIYYLIGGILFRGYLLVSVRLRQTLLNDRDSVMDRVLDMLLRSFSAHENILRIIVFILCPLLAFFGFAELFIPALIKRYEPR